MKRFLCVLSLALLPAFALAAESVEVKVKGMVCAFCAQGIKKKFSSQAAVEKVEVNLDKKWVKLAFKDKQSLTDEKIKTLIKDAGYNVDSIQRTKN